VPQYSLRRHSTVGKEADQEESHAGEQSRPRRSTRVKLEQHNSDEEKQEESEQADEDEGAKANKDLEDADHAEKSKVTGEEVSTFLKVREYVLGGVERCRFAHSGVLQFPEWLKFLYSIIATSTNSSRHLVEAAALLRQIYVLVGS
jgi:hypothetical protein